jgi:hypothetical protein
LQKDGRIKNLIKNKIPADATVSTRIRETVAASV